MVQREGGTGRPSQRESTGPTPRHPPTGLGFGVEDLGIRSLGFRVWGLGFGVWGLGFRVEG